MKRRPPEPLDHPCQIDERSSRSLVENADETGQPQASTRGSLSRLPIIEDHLIRLEILRQENRFTLTRLKMPQIPRYP